PAGSGRAAHRRGGSDRREGRGDRGDNRGPDRRYGRALRGARLLNREGPGRRLGPSVRGSRRTPAQGRARRVAPVRSRVSLTVERRAWAARTSSGRTRRSRWPPGPKPGVNGFRSEPLLRLSALLRQQRLEEGLKRELRRAATPEHVT